MDYYLLDKVALSDGHVGLIDELTESLAKVATDDDLYLEVPLEQIVGLADLTPDDINYNDNQNIWADKIGGKYPWEMGYVELVDYFNRDFRRPFDEARHMVRPFSPDVTAVSPHEQIVSGVLINDDGTSIGPVRIVQPGHQDQYGVSIWLHQNINWMLTRTGRVPTMTDLLLLVHQPNIFGISIAATETEQMYMIMPNRHLVNDQEIWQTYQSVINDLNDINVLTGPVVWDNNIEGDANEATLVIKMILDRLGWTYRVRRFNQIKNEGF
jgi:hypothetical protein